MAHISSILVHCALLLRCCASRLLSIPANSNRLFKPSLVGRKLGSKHKSQSMDETFPCVKRMEATSRLCNVSSYSTELLEMQTEDPSLHIFFIPGNPGAISFYKEFIEALYELLEGRASISAIGHISHTKKDWERGQMFTLQDQIDHKIDFIKEEMKHTDLPIVLVGHSIGAYICLEIFKNLPKQVTFAVGLYPFLTLNRTSTKQSLIGMLARSSVLSSAISWFVTLIGLFPDGISSFLVKRLLVRSWSATAVNTVCSHLLQYHTIRNVLFMAMTEFEKLSEEPDWTFMKEKENEIALLFGIDDHWGPLALFEELSRRVPGVAISIEREGHMHAYCCTEAGSRWVADHVATLIKEQTAKPEARSE